MRRGFGGRTMMAVGLVLVGQAGAAVMAQAPTPPPPSSPAQAPAGQQSVQQMFDAADAASSAGDHAAAVTILEALGQRVRSPRSVAIVRLRHGMALGKLYRWTEARPLLEQALAALPADDRSLDLDRGQALRTLGALELAELDHEAARDYFARALAGMTDPIERIATLSGMVQAVMFIEPEKGLAYADEALALVDGLEPALAKPLRASAANLRGQMLLNLGRFAEAEAVLAKAVSGEGGLTLRVNYDDLVVRSNAAIAALLAGHRSKSREYLIYTGAGRMQKQDFSFGADMPLPLCGEDGVRPDDVAVVEFGIADDGAVSYARPVYGSRPGPMAIQFARSVRQWSWRPEEIAKIPPLMRLVTRLELRCTTNIGGPSLPLMARAAFRDWAEQRGVVHQEVAAGSDVKRRAMLEAELVRLRAAPGRSPVREALVLSDLLENPLVTGKARTEHAAAFGRILSEAGAPPMVMLWSDGFPFGSERGWGIDDTRYVADPVAQSLARLILYDGSRHRRGQKGRPLLDAVLADNRLPADHPLRIAALVRRASARAAAGDRAGALADYAATGLTAQQCSIVDAAPRFKSAGLVDREYPTDMVTAGIEGWVQIEQDIGGDGRTLNPRVIAAYPPMVFSPNATRISAYMRYDPAFRPEGGMACSASTSRISFRTQGA